MKQKYKVQMVAGIFLLLASNVLAFLSVCPEDPLTPMRYLVPVGLALVIIPVLRHRRYGNEPYKDERTNNIITRGFVYSWYLTIGVMVALFVVDDVGVLTMTVQNTLAMIILVATISFLIFRWYLFQKEAMI